MERMRIIEVGKNSVTKSHLQGEKAQYGSVHDMYAVCYKNVKNTTDCRQNGRLQGQETPRTQQANSALSGLQLLSEALLQAVL